MTDKEKITEILKAYTKKHNISASSVILEEYAEELLANGVILPPCKVGDMVYILEEKCKFSGEENKPWDSCKQYWDNVFKNKMWGCMGKAENGSLIYCKQKEMVWYAKEVEYSLLFYSNPDIVLGQNLFLTKEEAEKALAEMNGEFCFACEHSNEDRTNLSGDIRCEKLHIFVNPKHRCVCYASKSMKELLRKLRGSDNK